MTFSKPIKILIGVLTLLVELTPFLVVPLFFMFPVFMGTFSALGSEMSEGAESLLALFATLPFFIIMPLMWCYSFTHLVAQVFYIIQIVKNKVIGDTPRILFILGTFFMPIIAMPLFFILHIWKEPAQPAGEAGAASAAA